VRDQISVAARKDSGHLPFTWRNRKVRLENQMVRSRHFVLESSENMGCDLRRRNTFQAFLSRQSNPVNTATEGTIESVRINGGSVLAG